jgi:hypothetical protein
MSPQKRRSMARSPGPLAAAALLAFALVAARAGADTFPPPPVASYQITCRLDLEKKTIEGAEVLTWKNTTSRAADTLRFHLYLNAFRNTSRRSGGSPAARTAEGRSPTRGAPWRSSA